MAKDQKAEGGGQMSDREIIAELKTANQGLADAVVKAGKERDDTQAKVAELTLALKRIAEDRDQALAKCEELTTALMGAEKWAGAVVVADEDRELTEAELALIEAACDAYGIDEESVNSMRIEEGAAVVVTKGGSRIRYRRGDEKAEGFKPLGYVQVTGINPNAKKRKPIAGKERK